MTAGLEKRQIERHNSAVIRALSGKSQASYRHQRLWDDKGPVPLKTSHLSLDIEHDSYRRCRGVADAIGLRLKHSNTGLHQRLMPKGYIAGMLFDTLEQLRAEALADPGLAGVRQNLNAAFTEWQRDYIHKRLTENHAGLVIFTLIQVVRSNMLGIMPTREVTPIIEEPQFHVIPIISKPLARLRKHLTDQAAYARYALEISTRIAEFIHDDMDDDATSRYKIPMPADFEQTSPFTSGLIKGNKAGVGNQSPASAYHVFTRAYDRIVDAASLYPVSLRQGLRRRLDKQIAAQVISIPRLAIRMQRLFGLPQRAGWDFGQDEGRVDARRLAQLVANPHYHTIYKREHHAPTCDTVVSFLIDNSGSMKRQRYESVAVLVDIFCQALELAGAKTEILGFSTGSWNGGRALKGWRRAGQPSHPGRLNEALFVVYKSADTPWRRARYSIAAMLNTLHYREGLDGEALDWAARRLGALSEQRRVLVMISDGAPMDSATTNTNSDSILAQHLYDIASQIELRSPIKLGAIGIDLDLGDFFQNSLNLDLKGTLDKEAFAALEVLFRNRK